MQDQVPPVEQRGREHIRYSYQSLFASFEDAEQEPGLVLLHGDEVVIVGALHGTHTGPFLGHAATKRTVGVLTASRRTLGPDGLAREEHVFIDQASVLVQLGLDVRYGGRARVAPGSFGKTRWITAKDDATERDNLAAYERFTGAFNLHVSNDVVAGLTDDAIFRSLTE